MPLTPEELTRAIAQWQGSVPPITQLPATPATLAAPGPAPVVVPPVQEMAAPPPAVEAALPPSAPAAYVVPATHNSREGMVQMDNAAAAQANAISDETAAKAALDAQQSDLIAKQTQEQAQAMEQFQAQQAENQARTQKIYDDSQKIESEASMLQARDRRTTTQRSLGMIGTALGGLADGLSGFSGKNTNFALNIEKSINDAVEKDMAQQQAAIDGKHKQAAMKLTEFGIAHKLFVDDPKAAFEYASLLRKDMYAKDLEALTKRSANPIAVAQGAQAAQKIIADNVEKKTSLLSSQENTRVTAAAAMQRQEATAANAYRPGAQSIASLEAKAADKTITPDEVQELAAVRAAEDAHRKKLIDEANAENSKGPDGKPLTEGQAKAGALFKSSQSDADRIEAALKNNTLPGAAVTRAAESSLIPDAAIPAQAQIYRSGRALVNDVLRDESGASIGIPEKEELLSGLKSTDPEVRRQAYVRILAKRAAMGAKVPQKPGTVQGIKAGGKAVDASKVIAPDVPPGRIAVINPDGSAGTVPADKLDLALSRGYKRAE